jgi:hypothetical protein
MQNATRNAIAGLAALLALAALAYGLTGMLNPAGQTVPLKPYLLALFAVPVLCAAGFTILYHLGWRTHPEPRSVEGGMYEVRPKSSRRDWALLGSLVALVWNAINIPVALHYFTYPRTERGPAGTAAVLVLLAIGLAIGALAAYNLLSLLRVEEARLLVQGKRIFLGQELIIRLVQKSAADIHVERVRVGLVCVPAEAKKPGGASGSSSKSPSGRPTPAVRAGAKAPPVFESWKESWMKRDVKKGERVRVDHTLNIPATAPPSIPPGRGRGPRHDWSIFLVTKLSQGADYQAEFPLRVEVRPKPGAEEREVGELISRYSTAKRNRSE